MAKAELLAEAAPAAASEARYRVPQDRGSGGRKKYCLGEVAMRPRPVPRVFPGRTRAEVTDVLRRAIEWSSSHADARGLALVGSEARGDARPDSDVDLVLLTEEVRSYVESDDWISEMLGRITSVETCPRGTLTERRLTLPSGLEVEVGITRCSWASTSPVDPGTRQVVRGGISVLYDPDGLLVSLLDAC